MERGDRRDDMNIHTEDEQHAERHLDRHRRIGEGCRRTESGSLKETEARLARGEFPDGVRKQEQGAEDAQKHEAIGEIEVRAQGFPLLCMIGTKGTKKTVSVPDGDAGIENVDNTGRSGRLPNMER